MLFDSSVHDRVGHVDRRDRVGNNSSRKIRIRSALIAVGGEKLNPSAICDRAAISRDSRYDHRDDLVETFGVIEEVDQAGNSPMYRVDLDDPLIKRLSEARDLAAKQRNQSDDN